MGSDEQPSPEHASMRIAWGARALAAAAEELHALGASAAAGILADEADRVEELAGEVRELAKGDVDVPAPA
jgi:hypothetical protein